MAEQVPCRICGKHVYLTVLGKYRKHNAEGLKENCDGSGTFAPTEQVSRQLPPKSPKEDACPEESPSPEMSGAAPSGAACATSSTAKPDPAPEAESITEPVTTPTETTTIPGSDTYAEALSTAKAESDAESTWLRQWRQAAANRGQFIQPAPPEAEAMPLFRQPAQPKQQQAEHHQDMTELGKQVATQMKEIFFAYSNRLDRNVQTTLGPSEAGTPCDRQLAMKLMGVKPTNPGGDNWASFVGTCVHVGLEDMFRWADANTGRFATELRLEFPSEVMPHGTGDLLDRVLCMFDDHKLMGRWSRNKLKRSGPTPTYYNQVMLYAWAARRRGEKVDHVAIIGWPRDESSLDDLYVWTAPYDPTVARDAMARLENIKAAVDNGTSAENFATADDCRFCPFHLKDARNLDNGACSGK